MKGDKEHDCAMDILKTAKTPWQKNVGETLVNLEIEVKWVKKEMVAVSGLMVAILIVLVKSVLGN